ncbi:MAG: hypothetical protein R3182_13120 [Draconibacterium sp.]|nr:hypothetical protein [Draconibacterium sp.]
MKIITYTVWFEIFGKKMKTTVPARTEKEAKEAVRKKIIFHKIECDNKTFVDDAMDKLKDILNIFDDDKEK